MKWLAALCFIAAVALGALEHLDRTSSHALTIVEWGQRLGVPLFVVAILIGLATMAVAILGTKRPAPRAHTPARPTVPTRTKSLARPPLSEANTLVPEPFDESKSVSALQADWRDQVRALAQDLDLGKGARITFDLGTKSPITLHLEHLSPAHCKRAIAATGNLFSVIPTPPRLKVIFDHCPVAGVPRHHQVAGALAQVLARGDFRVVSHVDTVDVMFHRPDPAWSD